MSVRSCSRVMVALAAALLAGPLTEMQGASVPLGDTGYTFTPPPGWRPASSVPDGLVGRFLGPQGKGYLDVYAEPGRTTVASLAKHSERRMQTDLKGRRTRVDRRIDLRGTPSVYRVFTATENRKPVYAQALYYCKGDRAFVLMAVIPSSEYRRLFKPAQHALLSLRPTVGKKPPTTAKPRPTGARRRPRASAKDALPLGNPRANTSVKDVVPLRLVERIAADKARKVFGRAALGPPLPCCDDDGDIVAYMFPCALERESFPSYSEILASVKKGRRMAKEGPAALTDEERQEFIDRIKNERGKGTSASKQGEAALGDRALKRLVEAGVRKAGRLRSIGEGQFGTVVVSARYDRFPVPMYAESLPTYYYQGDLVAERARATLSAQQPKLERVYFLGFARGQWFEVSSGGKNALMRTSTLETRLIEKVLTRKGAKAALSAKKASRIAGEWTKAKKNVQWR